MLYEHKNEIKVILLGNPGVGKTSLINTCVGLSFSEKYESTSSSSYMRKDFNINNKKYLIDLWDTAGQEKFKSITKIFVKGSDIVVFVYDITDDNSFKALEEWIKMSDEIIENKYICGIVGNKQDLFLNEGGVPEEEAKEYADKKNMPFEVVSAKEDPQTFELFLKQLVEKHLELKEENKEKDEKSEKNEKKEEEKKTIGLKSEEPTKKKKKFCFGVF